MMFLKAEQPDKTPVNDGVNLEALVNEIIQRCRATNPPPCEAACPIHLDVRGYVNHIAKKNWADALSLIRERLPFPGILGRVCNHVCETECRRADLDQPVAICALKRFAADRGDSSEWDIAVEEEKKEKVAIIGSGPAGLMAAYELGKKGYKVTIIEALSRLGGMLACGIPEYRLPRELLDSELAVIERLGIEVRLNTCFGKDVNLSQLFDRGYKAVFLAIGAHRGISPGIPGEDADGVVQGVELLRKLNFKEPIRVRGKIVVIGGGNVAIDVSRSACRLGSEVTVVYRRTREEMPAWESEVEHALEEGVGFQYQVSPLKVLVEDGRVAGLRCLRTEPGEPDESGRRRPRVLEDSGFDIECDMLVLAVGQRPEVLSFKEKEGLKLTERGLFDVDPVTLATSREGVFAGGDARLGPSTVVEALADGRRAAVSIDLFLRGLDVYLDREDEGIYETPIKIEIQSGTPKADRATVPVIPPSDRKGGFQEVELGFSEDDAVREAHRCLNCECLICLKNCEFLRHNMSPRDLAGSLKEDYRFDPTIPCSCNICNLCGELCPEGLDTGKLCQEVRKRLFYEGLLPLHHHKSIINHQKWGTSRVFKLAKANPDKQKDCRAVFFPGCTLPAYSPDLVVKVYEYLSDKLPGIGVALNCCGGPSYLIGEMNLFQEILAGIDTQMQQLGASEIITACTKCYHTLMDYTPQYKISPLWDVLMEIGLPPEASDAMGKSFAIHDSCPARYEEGIQESVRRIVEMMGFRAEEMEFNGKKTRCCGGGGMMAPVDPELFKKIIRLRVNETSHDIVTYCAGCRENFSIKKKPTLHALDLVFNPNWDRDRTRPPRNGFQRWKNRWDLKRRLKRL